MGKTLLANAGDLRDEVLTLGQEDPPEEGMATHSSLLTWRIPGTGEPGGVAQSRARLKRLSSSSRVLKRERPQFLKS